MQETGSVSVIEPIGEAMNWMQDRLFNPFNLGEWFVFGFAWFLAGLAQFGGGGGNVNVGGGPDGTVGGGDPGAPPPDELLDQAVSVLSPTVILMIVVGLLIGFGVLALFIWLGSRGTFIFLDCTLRESAAITEPWSEYSELGNSLFRVRLAYFIISAIVGFLFVIGGGLGIYALVWDGNVSGGAIALIVFLVLLMACAFILLSLFYQLLDDFVVQIMYRRDMYCWDAFQLFWRELLSQYPGTFLLFYLMKFLLSIGAVFIMFIGGCLTCCIGFLPYLKNVIFLPVGVFFRTYSIRMLAQFGSEWSLDPQDEGVAELF